MTHELWGVFHLLPNGTPAREPRVLCTSEELAQREAQRFSNIQVAPYTRPVPEANAPDSSQPPLFSEGA